MNNQRRQGHEGAGSASVVTVALAVGLLKPGSLCAAWNKAGYKGDKHIADATIA